MLGRREAARWRPLLAWSWPTHVRQGRESAHQTTATILVVFGLDLHLSHVCSEVTVELLLYRFFVLIAILGGHPTDLSSQLPLPREAVIPHVLGDASWESSLKSLPFNVKLVLLEVPPPKMVEL